MGNNRQIVIRRAVAFLAVLILCFLLVHYGRTYAVRAWGSLRLVDTIVNLTPTFLSILFAFVVDKDLAGNVRWRWLFRLFVFGCGLALSGLLWHQQTLADKASEESSNKLLNDAIAKANAHSDGQFENVQKKIDGVDGKVADVGSALQGTTTSLSHDIQKTAEAIQTTSDRLDASIGKVGKPDPPHPAILQASLWKSGSPEPIDSMSISPETDGTYQFDVSVRNTSDVGAEESDVWIVLCDACSFAKEPEGFEKVVDIERHKRIGLLNPGVAQKVTVNLRITTKSSPLDFFEIGIRTSCKNCGKLGPIKPLKLKPEPLIMPQIQ